jgi:hypothetical protein
MTESDASVSAPKAIRMGRFEYRPHTRTTAHQKGEVHPTKVADQIDRSTPVARANAWLALKITGVVGSMWCAYVFAAIALIGLPTALKPGGEGIIAWIAQTFLQLVLLSVIIVGQNLSAAASDKRSENTYKDAEAVLHEALQIQAHLLDQDVALTKLLVVHGATTDGGPGAPTAPAPPAPSART